MREEFDFEKYWLEKFSRCLGAVAGDDIREEVMKGSEGLSGGSDREEVFEWTRGAMEKLDSLLDEEKRRDVMAGCACQYPQSDLEEIRKTYVKTGDIDAVHGLLKEQFVSFLKNVLQLNRDLIDDMVARGWGVVGIKKE